MWKSQRSPSETCLKYSSNYVTVTRPVDLDPELDVDNELPGLNLDVPIDLPRNCGVVSDPHYGLQDWS